MSDSDGLPDFYCEINTPASIKQNYAPAGRCLGCDAKLSRYRTQTGGEWDRWCAPCQDRGIFELQCEGCWETFPSFGVKTICSKCLVPSQRDARQRVAVIRARDAWEMWCQDCSIEKVVVSLGYSSKLEMMRAIKLYLENWR